MKNIRANRFVLIQSAVAIVAIGGLLVWLAPAHASIIVDDTWIDGDRTLPASPTYSENGTDTDSDGDIESAWYQGGGGTLAPVGPSGAASPLRGTGYGTSSASWTTYFTPEAAPVTLANAGDSMKVTWTFTPTAAVAQTNTSQNFRLAIVDSPSAARLSANGSPASSTYAGYGMFMNMAIGTSTTPENLGATNAFQLTERDGTNGNLLSTAGSPPWTALANGAAKNNHGYDSGTSYTYTFTATRNVGPDLLSGTLDDTLTILSTMVGGTLNNTGTASVNFTDTTPNSFTYDTFSLRMSAAGTTADTFDTSRFKVEFTAAVPEVSSFLMVGLVGIGGFAVRRMRRQKSVEPTTAAVIVSHEKMRLIQACASGPVFLPAVELHISIHR